MSHSYPEFPTTEYEDMVFDFSTAFKQEVLTADLVKDEKLVALRLSLIQEEFTELKEAIALLQAEPSSENEAHVYKELGDLQYVLSGFAITFGLPMFSIVSRVHESNMSKMEGLSEPIYREDGKVLKGPEYQEAYLEDLISKKYDY